MKRPKKPTNEERQQASRERIKQGMKELREAGTLAPGITDRCQQLSERGVSRETLYKNKELWHPEHYREESPPAAPEIAAPEAQTAEPQAPEGIEPETKVITNPPLRSLGPSELPPLDRKSLIPKQTRKGGCRGKTEDSTDAAIDAAREQVREPEDENERGESVLDRVKAAAGDCWSATLQRLVEAADPQRVWKALEAYWEQAKRVAISNVGAWLHRAIVEGYEPNESAANSAERSEFNEWFEPARRAGLASAGEASADGQLWVYLSDGRKVLWSDLRREYPVEVLASQEPGFYIARPVVLSQQASEPVWDRDRTDAEMQVYSEPSEGGDHERAVPMPEEIRQWIARQKAKRRLPVFGI